MTTTEFYPTASPAPALVLDWPQTEGGLWDRNASELVEALEESLGVFVTCVGSGPRAMTLADALSAARFMGCTAAVVAAPSGGGATAGRSAPGRPRLPIVRVESAWSLPALAAGYAEACGRMTAAA